MANHKVQQDPFPADWMDDRYHGFAKVGRTRRYRPVLSLNGTQFYFGECKTREDAARAYDLLLKFFLAFSSSRAVPNFPDDFPALVKDSALLHEGDGCLTHSKLLAIEDELTKQFDSLGKSVSDYRSAREMEIQVGQLAPTRASKLVEAANNARRRAMIKLEVLSLKNMATADLTGLVRQLSIPKDKWNELGLLPEYHVGVETKFREAQEALVCYVRKLKTALDLDPNVSTK